MCDNSHTFSIKLYFFCLICFFFLFVRSNGHADRSDGCRECHDRNDHGKGAFGEDGAGHRGIGEICVIFIGEGRIAKIAIGKVDVCVIIRDIEGSGIVHATVCCLACLGLVIVEQAVCKGAVFGMFENIMADECNTCVIVGYCAIRHRERDA